MPTAEPLPPPPHADNPARLTTPMITAAAARGVAVAGGVRTGFIIGEEQFPGSRLASSPRLDDLAHERVLRRIDRSIRMMRLFRRDATLVP